MESSKFPPTGSTPGVLHYLPPNVCAFEPTKPLVRSMNINTLIWIGGMFDTLGSVGYPYALAKSLNMSWTLMCASLSSAGLSWGVGSIAKDAEDIAKIVAYTKARYPTGKIVIMGHSTGCQDCMEYVVGKNADKRPAVDGVILQAPVSDREGVAADMDKALMQEADEFATKLCEEGKGRDALPNRLTGPVFGRIAISARRWLDISSPAPDHAGADDYFSSDLPDERLKTSFGRLPASAPVLILEGGSDPTIPEFVDKQALVQRWWTTVKQGGGNADEVNGGVVPGATHNLNTDDEKIVQDLIQRVVGFIDRLGAGDFSSSATASRI